MRKKTQAVEIIPARVQQFEYELHSHSRSLSQPLPDDLLFRNREDDGDSPPAVCERVFDPVLGCWVMARPRRDISRLGRKRARRLPVSIPDKSGKWWWVGDRTSGVRILKIERLCWHEARTEAQRLFPGEDVTVFADRGW